MNDEDLNGKSFWEQLKDVGRDIKENGEYFIPFKGTYKSWKDYKNSRDPWDLVSTVTSGIGDLAIIGGPISAAVKGVGFATKGANLASKANKTAKLAKTWEESAKAAKAAGNTKKASRLQRGSTAAVRKAANLKEDAKMATDGAIIMGQAIPGFGLLFYESRLPKTASLKDLKEKKKQNYVEKNQTPYLYNTFLKKLGGTITLIPKHQDGSNLNFLEKLRVLWDGSLPSRFRGSKQHPYPLKEVVVATKGNPYLVNRDWYNADGAYFLTSTIKGFDSRGNDSTLSTRAIVEYPQSLPDTVYSIGEIPMSINQFGEPQVDLQNLLRNNILRAKPKFFKDYYKTQIK